MKIPTAIALTTDRRRLHAARMGGLRLTLWDDHGFRTSMPYASLELAKNDAKAFADEFTAVISRDGRELARFTR